MPLALTYRSIFAANQQKRDYNIYFSLTHARTIPLCHFLKHAHTYTRVYIAIIRQSLDSDTVQPPSVPDFDPPFSGTVRSEFRSVSEEEVNKILKHNTVKTCDLDPLPACLSSCWQSRRSCPPFYIIISDFLSSGPFSGLFKTAIVKPLLKKSSLSPGILKNNRPVSSLSCLSKVWTESFSFNSLTIFRQTVCSSLISQLIWLVLGIVNDLLSGQDDNKLLLLSLLDLSVAFDITESIHSFQYYVSQHFFWPFRFCSLLVLLLPLRPHPNSFVSGYKSLPTVCQFGVPQGSVLGPMASSCTFNLSLLLSVPILSFITVSLMTINLITVSFIISSSQTFISDVQACMHHCDNTWNCS